MNQDKKGKDWFKATFDVSRETLARLEAYADILQKWNAKINLVSATDLPQIWERHFADSAQLFDLVDGRAGHWVDLGSGAGFPGLVLAARAQDTDAAIRFTLVESDQRKAVFLSEAARAMSLDVRVAASRVERLLPLEADILTARALAPLTVLLGFTEKHRQPDGIALFPKGQTVHKEIEDAARTWRFTHLLHPSVTDAKSAVVEVGTLSKCLKQNT